MKPRLEFFDLRPSLKRVAQWADAYFVSDELRNQSANQVANTRMGLLFCVAASVATLLFLSFNASIWETQATLGGLVIASALFALPFVLRQTRWIRFLGHVVCGVIAAATAAATWSSAGQTVGILSLLPALIMISFLIGGRKAALYWSVVAMGIACLGLALIATNQLPSPSYRGASEQARYAITIVCILWLGAAAQLFDAFWNRTAAEVAAHARQELIAREELNRSFLEHATEGVMIVDADAIVKFASPAAERLLGVLAGGAIGQRLRDFTNPMDYENTRTIWTEVLSSPSYIGRLSLRTQPDLGRGDPADAKNLEVTCANRLDSSAVNGVIVRMRDKTDLIRAEANYEALVEHSFQGIAVLCEGRIVYVNQALADIFQTSRENVIRHGSLDSLEFLHKDDQELIRDRFSDSGQETSESLEMRFIRTDGSKRWLLVQWTRASWEGRPARQIVYADITAHKKLAAHQEREHERLEVAILERTLELEASQARLREQERMAVVGTLAAGIAHQINNPVGAILTPADFALLTADEEDGAQIQREALADIRAQAIRCGKIVRSVLQFSRAEPTEKWSDDLARVVRTAIDLTSRYANERGARVDLVLSPAVSDCSILMSPIELEQVFVNLIRNATESQPFGATVHVSTSVVEDEVQVIVEDDGPGIPEELMSRVFDPFFTTRLRQGGTGLGLAVARSIIEDHGGRIWLENIDLGFRTVTSIDSLDKTPRATSAGVRFYVRLPIEKDPARM